MKFRKYLRLVVLSTSLAACGGGGGSGSGGNNSGSDPAPQQTFIPITVDNAGVVPAFKDASSKASIYLHNNSTLPIQDITYSWDVNVINDSSDVGGNFLKLNPLDSGALTSVPANGSLRLPVIIPKLEGKTGQGAAVLKVSYTYKGKKYSFDHVVNFQLVNENSKGVFISSSSVSSSFGNNNPGYTTLYVYATGSSDAYKINSIKIDPVLGNIVQGDLADTGGSIISHQVATIELNTAMVARDAVGQISIDYSGQSTLPSTGSLSARMSKDITTSGSDSKSVSVSGYALIDNSMVILPSFIPFIDTSINPSSKTQTNKAYFYNASNKSVTISGFSADSGISLQGNNCSSLTAGQACAVNFNLTGNPKSGSGQITATATAVDGSSIPLSIQVSWYNSVINTPQLGITTDTAVNPVFLTKANNLYSGSFNATVTNLSNITLTNLNVATPQIVGGSATVVSSTGANCTGKTLESATSSCSYTVSLADSKNPDSGLVKLSASASANNVTVNASGYGRYLVYQSLAQLALSYTPATLSIIGNNTESQRATIKITNLGADSSTDIGSLFVQSAFTVESPNASQMKYSATTNCNGQPLAHSSSCIESVILLPQNYQSGIPLQANLAYTVSASNVLPIQAWSPLRLVVQSYDNAVALVGVQSFGNRDGDGKSAATAVRFLAGDDTNKKLVLTYKNMSTLAANTVYGVSFAAGLPAGWQVEYSDQDPSSCLTNSTSLGNTIAAGGSCTITLDNNLYLLGDSNTVSKLDFAFPTLYIGSESSNKYALVPANSLGFTDNKYYANNYQAVIIDSDSIINNGTNDATLKISHQAVGVNTGGYAGGSITEKTRITPAAYLKMPTTTDSNCSIASESGSWVETCSLAESASTTNNYKVVWSDSYTGGVDSSIGATLTINYTDLLSGKIWAYHNNTTIAGVNGGSDLITIQKRPSNFRFGGYSQWIYKSGDSNLYTFKVQESHSIFGNNISYAAVASSSLFASGVNAVVSLESTVYVATGGNSNRITSCNFDRYSGAVDVGNCVQTQSVSRKLNANLTDLLIIGTSLYALDNQGGITLCSLSNTGTISSCSATALDAPVLTIGSGRQQRLLHWNGWMIYTVPGATTTQYLYCKIENSGVLDSCKQLVIDPSAVNTTSISTSILIPANSSNVYLYTMSRKDAYVNTAYGCVLTDSGTNLAVSNCQAGPMYHDPKNIPSTMAWGDYNQAGALNGVAGDDYVIYYDAGIQHLVGTATASSANDGDLNSSAPLVGQEFYLVTGSDNTIYQPLYLNFMLKTVNSSSFWVLGYNLSTFNQVLGNSIAGSITGSSNGQLIVDTLSIH